jgi:hypothetical protein
MFGVGWGLGRGGNGAKNLKGSEGRPVQAIDPTHTKWKRTIKIILLAVMGVNGQKRTRYVKMNIY